MTNPDDRLTHLLNTLARRGLDPAEHDELRAAVHGLVVLGTDHDDITPARDADGNHLVYDADMHRVSPDEQHARTAVSLAADRAGWPARADWEEGPDALRDPWLYEAGDIDGEDDAAADTEDDDLEPLDLNGQPADVGHDHRS